MNVFHRKVTIVNPRSKVIPGRLFSRKYRLRTWCGFAIMDLNNWWSTVLAKASNVGKSYGREPPLLSLAIRPFLYQCDPPFGLQLRATWL